MNIRLVINWKDKIMTFINGYGTNNLYGSNGVLELDDNYGQSYMPQYQQMPTHGTLGTPTHDTFKNSKKDKDKTTKILIFGGIAIAIAAYIFKGKLAMAKLLKPKK